jgi:pyrroloquinoline quinone biosynthesis protein B
LPPRLQAAAALSPDGKSWYLINATPDVTAQLARWPELHPREGVRHTPFQGIMLTDGEFDHTLGLLHLREGAGWTLYATPAVMLMLEESFAVLPALRGYIAVDVAEAQLGTPLIIGTGAAQVAVQWLETGQSPPRYTESNHNVLGAVTAIIFEDLQSGRRLAYAPGVGQLSEELFEQLSSAEVVLFDGTFWTDDEFQQLGGGERSARTMGHVPIDGPDGSAVWLAELPAKIRRYVHVNNSNPILDPTSEQRQRLRKLGLEVAEDGDEVEL